MNKPSKCVLRLLSFLYLYQESSAQRILQTYAHVVDGCGGMAVGAAGFQFYSAALEDHFRMTGLPTNLVHRHHQIRRMIRVLWSAHSYKLLAFLNSNQHSYSRECTLEWVYGIIARMDAEDAQEVDNPAQAAPSAAAYIPSPTTSYTPSYTPSNMQQAYPQYPRSTYEGIFDGYPYPSVPHFQDFNSGQFPATTTSMPNQWTSATPRQPIPPTGICCNIEITPQNAHFRAMYARWVPFLDVDYNQEPDVNVEKMYWSLPLEERIRQIDLSELRTLEMDQDYKDFICHFLIYINLVTSSPQ